MDELRRRTGRGPWHLTPEALAHLQSQPWPGNVRQLFNTLERATILTQQGALSPSDLGEIQPSLSVTQDSARAETDLLTLNLTVR